MINVLVIVMEAITMWLCLHIAFGEKIKKNLKEIYFFILYSIAFIVSYYNYDIKKFFTFIIIAIAYIWCSFVFIKNAKQIVIRVILATIIVGTIESCIIMLSSFLFKYSGDIEVKCLISIIVCFVIAYILYSYKVPIKEKHMYELLGKKLLLLGCIVFAFLLTIKIQFDIYHRINMVNVLLFLTIIVLYVVICERQRIVYELKNRNLQYELESDYGKSYDALVKDIRRKQHDYSNQLSAVYSLDDIGNNDAFYNEKNLYLEVLNNDNKTSKLLTRCNNTIIAGYLYKKICEYKKEGLSINLNINISDEKINTKTKDTIEILGVLLTNAYEYVARDDDNDKEINIELYDRDGRICMTVSNPAVYIKNDIIEEMFSLGYSTKGDNRGIGLYSVKHIVDIYSGYICVKNVTLDNKNWFQVNIII